MARLAISFLYDNNPHIFFPTNVFACPPCPPYPLAECVGAGMVLVVYLGVGKGGAWLLCGYQAGDENNQGFTTSPPQYLRKFIDPRACKSYVHDG